MCVLQTRIYLFVSFYDFISENTQTLHNCVYIAFIIFHNFLSSISRIFVFTPICFISKFLITSLVAVNRALVYPSDSLEETSPEV